LTYYTSLSIDITDEDEDEDDVPKEITKIIKPKMTEKMI
jgi:hypothetical protein